MHPRTIVRFIVVKSPRPFPQPHAPASSAACSSLKASTLFACARGRANAQLRDAQMRGTVHVKSPPPPPPCTHHAHELFDSGALDKARAVARWASRLDMDPPYLALRDVDGLGGEQSREPQKRPHLSVKDTILVIRAGKPLVYNDCRVNLREECVTEQ